jgi:type II secretory pathway predicted ATPase ExeA
LRPLPASSPPLAALRNHGDLDARGYRENLSGRAVWEFCEFSAIYSVEMSRSNGAGCPDMPNSTNRHLSAQRADIAEVDLVMEDFFGLSGRPFAAAPRTDRYFPAASIEAARATLVRAVERAEGPTLVIGPVGTGKSLLLRLIAEHFCPTLRVTTLAAGRIHSRRTLWQALLYELGLPYRGMDDGELRLAVVGHLTGPQASQKPVLLLVDEAHTLSPRLLDELRTLTELATDGQPAVRLVLAGGPTLEEHFAHPKLESFSQRLAARCYLEPLTRDETAAFISAQVTACHSCAEALFDADAFAAVYHATDGIPRLVNQVCDHALVLAYADGVTEISAALVEQAWADLQQLPTPWSVPSPSSRASSGTVEFGRLDDEEPFEPDGEIPSVRFPTERVGRRAANTDEATFDDNREFTEEVATADEFNAGEFEVDVETFAVHSADDILHDDEYYVTADAATQIELSVVETAADPFGEPFAEEEPVVDRVAALPATQSAQKPPAAPPRPTVRPAATSSPAASKPSESPALSPTGTVVLSTTGTAPPAVAPAAIRPTSVTWPSADPAALDQPAIAPLPMLNVSTPPKPNADAAARAAAAARKPRKYGQLFSQLRRNSG